MSTDSTREVTLLSFEELSFDLELELVPEVAQLLQDFLPMSQHRASTPSHRKHRAQSRNASTGQHRSSSLQLSPLIPFTSAANLEMDLDFQTAILSRAQIT